MNTLTLYKNNKNYFLNYNGSFTDDFTQILPNEVEIVSNNDRISFFRIKFYNNLYLSFINDKIQLISEKNDSNLMYRMNLDNKIFFVNSNRYLTDNNLQLEAQEFIVPNRMILNTIFPSSEIRFGSGTFSKVQELFMNGLVVLDINLEALMKPEFDEAREIVNNSPHKRISDLLLNSPCFQKLLCRPEIKEFLSQIFKTGNERNGYHLTTFSSNRVNREARNSQAGWHVDYPYHNLPTENSYPIETLGLQLLILLDDFRSDNGGTEYILGSHVHRRFPAPDDISANGNCHRKLTAKKGSVVVWLGKLWHREGLSQVDDYRSALLANFSPLSVPAKDNIKDHFKYENEGLKLENDKIIFTI
jgi:hypothetical protein